MRTQSPSAQPTCFDCPSQLQCQTKPYPSNWPFHDKVEDAIILFSILIKGIQIHPGHFHFPETHPFTFIVHCHALLDHIPPVHHACAPFSSIPKTVQVPWEVWGITVTLWFKGDPASMHWIMMMAGQRAVTMEEKQAGTHGSNGVTGMRFSRMGTGCCLSWRIACLMRGLCSKTTYFEIVTQAEYQYEGVLIDKERILGLKVCRPSSSLPASPCL